MVSRASSSFSGAKVETSRAQKVKGGDEIGDALVSSSNNTSLRSLPTFSSTLHCSKAGSTNHKSLMQNGAFPEPKVEHPT